MSRFITKIGEETQKIMVHNYNQRYPIVLCSLFAGAGISYILSNKDFNAYIHVPLFVFWPVTCAGYHLYENKERIIEYVHKCPKIK
jgi:hypothetical protein